MWVCLSASWWSALPLSNHLEICLENGYVFYIYSKVSLQTSVRGGGAFTLVVSCCDGDGISAGGIVSDNAFVLLWMWVPGPSGVDVTTMLMRMLAAAGVSGASAIQDTLPCFMHLISIWKWCCMWWVPLTIDLPCCLCSCHWELLQRFVVIAHDNVRSLEIVFPFCNGVIDTIGILLGSAPFLLSVCECVWKKCDW